MTPTELLINSYISLLELPPNDEWRITHQSVYGTLREFIARDLNVSNKCVQDFCEGMAKHIQRYRKLEK